MEGPPLKSLGRMGAIGWMMRLCVRFHPSPNEPPHPKVPIAGLIPPLPRRPENMINAFLVFNGQGQPRLTKFYTQLVRLSTSDVPQWLPMLSR